MSALRYPDRVCRVLIRGLYNSDESGQIAKALDLPLENVLRWNGSLVG